MYLDAAPKLSARAVEVQTPTPGFPMQVYVADHINLNYPYGSSVPLSERGWQGPVASTPHVVSGQRIPIRWAGPPTATTCCGSRPSPPGTSRRDLRGVAVPIARELGRS